MNEHRRRGLLSSRNVVLGLLTALVLSLSTSIVPLSTTTSTLSSAFAQTTTPTCEGQTATIVGTQGANTLRGTSGKDVIVGLAGNDKIEGLAGNDVVCGGDGNDQIYGGDGDDTLSGDAGVDQLFGGNGIDILKGGAGNDQLWGEAGNDKLLDGGANTDSANGGAGIDICNAESETSCDERDTEAPILFVPDDQTVIAPSTGGVVISYSVTAQDNVDGTARLFATGLVQDNVGGDIAISCNPPSDSNLPIGSTTIKCTAKDAAGNEATESFTITVVLAPDTTAPTLVVPEDILIFEKAPTVVTFTVTAQDNRDGTARLDERDTLTQDDVGGDITISCNPPSGSTFPEMSETDVKCTAKDAAGNEATGSFRVSVVPV